MSISQSYYRMLRDSILSSIPPKLAHLFAMSGLYRLRNCLFLPGVAQLEKVESPVIGLYSSVKAVGTPTCAVC